MTGRAAALPVQLVKKASQSFASADAKALLYVFCRDMCVAENTLRGVSVELSAVRRMCPCQPRVIKSRDAQRQTDIFQKTA